MSLKKGQQKEMARLAGISPQYLNDILNRRLPCPPKRAHALGKAYFKLTGEYIPAYEFVFNWISECSIFKPITYEQLNQAREALYGPEQA